MFTTLRALTMLLVLTLLAGLAFACDDGGGEDDAPTPTAAVEETEEPDAPAADTPEAGLETTITGHIEGDFVAPDSHSFTQRFDFIGLSGEDSVIVIGDDAWIREGSGDWLMTAASDPEIIDTLDLTSADPDFFDGAELASDLAPLDSEVEEINGVSTRRYFIPADAVDTLVDLFGGEFLEDSAGLESFEMTVWIHAESDALIRADFVATAGAELLGDSPFTMDEGDLVEIAMVIDRTQINDDSIVIEPPDGSTGSPGEDTGEHPFRSYHYTVDLSIQIVPE